MYLKLREIFKQHPFLFLLEVFSILVGILPFCIYFLSENLRLASLTFLVPLLFTLFVFYKSYKYLDKNIYIKYLVFILNLIFILVVQVFLGMCFFFLYILWLSGGTFDNVKDYKKALRKISWQERVQHFPKVIPKEAQNIQLYQNYGSWFGSEGITLKFNIDNDYIEKELKKYNYVTIKEYNQYNAERGFYIDTHNGNIHIGSCTGYIINDKEHQKLEGAHFPYAYGICINKDKNEIIYFYSNPD